MANPIIPGGYVLQPRKLDDSEIMKAPPIVRELFQYIVRKVNHTDNEKYKRGSGFFTLADIQEDLSWYIGYRKMKYSKPQLTKSIRRLREGFTVATAKATRGLYITVLNYDKYQTSSNYESNDEGTTKETRRKREGHTKNKNVKNERMKESIINKYVLPDWINKELWSEYKKMRLKIKKPMTDYAEKLAVKELEKLMAAGDGQDKIVKQSIQNSWQGLFPVKKNGMNQKAPNRVTTDTSKYGED